MKDLINNFKRTTLVESSLSRVHQSISEHDSAIMTAFRNSPLSPEACSLPVPYIGKDEWKPDKNVFKLNKERNKELKAVLLRKGYGVTRVDGSYIENFGDISSQKEVSEESFIVINLKDDPRFFSTIEGLGKLFCQDSVLIIPQGGKGAYLLGTNDSWPGLGKRELVGSFAGGEEAEFMSRVRNRPFVFKEVHGQETFEQLSRNSKWAVSKISERVLN